MHCLTCGEPGSIGPWGPVGIGGVCRDPYNPNDDDEGQHIMTASTDTPPEPRTHHRGMAHERHSIDTCSLAYCGLSRAGINAYARGLASEPARAPETPVQRLRRLVDPATRNMPADEVLRAVVDVVADLHRQVGEQREMIDEQRGWMTATARKHGLTLEGDFVTTPLNQARKPIPTPNRPDQTPTEQRPDYLLDDDDRLCQCGTPHGQHSAGCEELPDQE